MFRKIVLCLSILFFYVNAASSEENIVILETNSGNITLKLYPKVAPKACENFISLAKNGYYDGVIFHRIIKNFMIQGGDPTGSGLGGTSMWNKPFEDEVSPYTLFEKEGLLAMANSGKNTNKSQFFITTVLTPWLNGRHTIFGEVIDGMNVVKKIENSATDTNNKPINPQTIIKVHVK
ncbi:MAG: peptidylprolyl isomerase [Campylobacteraceae bacterium]|jgi:peptidylprolyl isomerase|nr:peptidylprolyl isomerase [Campylobacteraceae bacterium]